MKKDNDFIPDDAINHFDLIGSSYEKLRHFEKNIKNSYPFDSKVFEKGKGYTSNPSFLAEINRLRKKWDIPDEGFWEDNLLLWSVSHPMSKDDSLYYQYLKDLDNLYLIINENHLWKDFCEYYLIFNEISPYAFPQKVTYHLEERADVAEPEIIIRVRGPVTKASDFDEAVKWSIRASKAIYKEGRTRTALKFDRDLEIYRLHEQGKSAKEIMDKINARLSRDEALSYDYINKIIKRFQSKMSKNTDT